MSDNTNDKVYINGISWSIPEADWKEHRQNTEAAMQQLAAQSVQLTAMAADMQHLATISSTLMDIKGGLLNTVMGKDVMATSTATQLLKEQAERSVDLLKAQQTSYTRIVLIFSLLAVVVLGLKSLAPSLF